MPSIFDMFASKIGDGQIDQIAKQLGADKNQTRDAISMTLPALIEAMGRKAEQNGGAAELHQKLGQASQGGGSMLDQLNDILPPETAPTLAPNRSSQPAPRQSQPAPRQSSPSHPSSSMPDIFGELLGNKQGRVSDVVSKSSGLGKDQVGSLISMLGPILAGMLGRQTKEKNMGPDELSEMLRQDRAKVQQSQGGGMLGKMFDQDGDGDFDMSDMMKLGMGMLIKK